MTKFAIITLSKINGDHQLDAEIRDQILKEIAVNRLLKEWKVDKIAIVSD